MAIFVVFDVVTTVIQIVGAALIGTAESNNTSPETANNILLAGLAIQVASFAVFLVLLAVCILRVLQKRGSGTWAHSATAAKLLFVLVVTSLLVELRTIFRLIETAQGAVLFTHVRTLLNLLLAAASLCAAALACPKLEVEHNFVSPLSIVKHRLECRCVWLPFQSRGLLRLFRVSAHHSDSQLVELSTPGLLAEGQ